MKTQDEKRKERCKRQDIADYRQFLSEKKKELLKSIINHLKNEHGFSI